MTPQLDPQAETAVAQRMPHLTEAELDALLNRSACGAAPSADDHLRDCDRCTLQLANLRASLSLFRDASTSYAKDQLRDMPPIPLPSRRGLISLPEPAWLAAAATLLFAAFIPMQHLSHRASPSLATTPTAVAASSAQSDEALLEDVDRETAEAVPVALHSLADPTAFDSNAASSPSLHTPSQRKD